MERNVSCSTQRNNKNTTNDAKINDAQCIRGICEQKLFPSTSTSDQYGQYLGPVVQGIVAWTSSLVVKF